MRQFIARVERYAEFREEAERLERLRLGQATAALMSLTAGRKGTRKHWLAEDVFADLKDSKAVEPESDQKGILRMFQHLAAIQKARVA